MRRETGAVQHDMGLEQQVRPSTRRCAPARDEVIFFIQSKRYFILRRAKRESKDARWERFYESARGVAIFFARIPPTVGKGDSRPYVRAASPGMHSHPVGEVD